MPPFKPLLLIIVGSLNIALSLSILTRNTKQLSNRSFAATSFALGGWAIGIAGFLLSHGESTAEVWAKIYYFFPQLVAVSIIMFAYIFARTKKLSKPFVVVVIAGFIAVVLPLLLFKSYLTDGLVYHEWGKEILLNKTHYLVYSTYLLLCLFTAEIIMFRKSRRLEGVYRAQAALFFWGFLVTGIFGVLFNLFYPWFGNYRFIWLGPLFTSAFVLAISYSIVRHKMFDVRLLVARSMTYVFTIGFIVIAYAAFLFGAGVVFVDLDNITTKQWIAVSTISLLLALTLGTIIRTFNRLTNKLFYRDAYDPQTFLDEFNAALVSTIELELLLRRASQVIENNLKTTFCAFGLKATETTSQRIISEHDVTFHEKDIQLIRQVTPYINRKVILADEMEEQQNVRAMLARNNVSVLVRLVEDVQSPKEGIGYIVLGPKKSGNLYNKQDTRILEIISNELVIAIQNAFRFEEIQQFNVTLQEKIDSATKQLKHANEKLVTLNDTKDDFISMASHQLRTPLTAVKGNISMVMDGDYGKLPKDFREPLGQAFASSERMVGLIADLLNVSRLRTGKFSIQPVPCNLDTVVKSELRQLQESAESRGHKLKYVSPTTFPTCMLDEIKIRQVIMNFVDNAIYYTPQGGHITVTLKQLPQAIEFAVDDNGIGVPRDLQRHLFTKFYRAGNAQKMRPDGTGIGLFMAKKVIIASGGSLIFKSVEGKGSTFGFNLPLDKITPPSITDPA